jgi:pyruvate/2-oxoglutarate dehydrogenase complex dihydrolipoamide acyltransferase (E2) component
MSTPIYFPLLNPNEPEALLANVYVIEGQKVSVDDPLCTLETTKSTSDLLAETDGYIAGLQCKPGQSVLAGELFCYLAGSPDWSPPEAQPALSAAKEGQDLPKDLRITQPALDMAHQAELDLSLLPVGPLITVEMVKGYLQKSGDPGLIAPESQFDASAIIIYGGGGHGKSLIDLVRLLHIYRIVGLVDDGITTDQTVMDVPVLGGAEKLTEL